jgi:para-nitrobenzyl esterase
MPQSEDCLSLTIVTPGADDSRRPILVWLHGGAYRSGAGSWDRYRGDRLAREGNAVVVNVNFRLGALGYLRSPGVSEGNLGLLDQLEALRWVRDNAGYLGGDPARITVVGQSSGAHSIACLLGVAQARALIRRAILQSPPMGLGLGSAAAAERLGQRFVSHLGQDPHQASLADILTAQQQVERDAAGRAGLNLSPPYGPVAGVDPLPDFEQWQSTCLTAASGLEIIIGTTRHELAYFLASGPISRRLPLIGRSVENGVIGLGTRSAFTRPTLKFADLLARAGAGVFVYRIDGHPRSSPYRACHCIDLPWLLGEEQDWAAAPMLSGQVWGDVDDFGRPLRSAWLSFASGGAPGLVERGWLPFSRRRGQIHRFTRSERFGQPGELTADQRLAPELSR